MEELIEKYIHIRDKISDYNKQLDNYKLKIKNELKNHPDTSFHKNGMEAVLKTQYRNTIHKKDVPDEFWEKYSVTTPYEVLSIKKK
jgi:hypothetical protein